MVKRLKYNTVLFDFDGTLCATEDGIIQTTTEVLTQMGIKIPEKKTLLKFIGPPPVYSYMHFLGMDQETAKITLKNFRRIYTEKGWKASHIYTGIDNLLKDLYESGAKICTASSKPISQIDNLLTVNNLRQYFCGLTGVDEHERGSDKPELIRRAMQICGETEKANTIMIGDTHFDAEGAIKAGVDFIGAGYGYGEKQELINAGAKIITDNVEGLYPLLFY